MVIFCFWSFGSSVSIVSDYRLDDQGSILGRGKGFFLYSLCPDRLWGSPSLLSNGYWGSFRVKRVRGMTLTIHPLLVPWSRMSRSYMSSPLVAFMAVARQLLYSVSKESSLPKKFFTLYSLHQKMLRIFRQRPVTT
jgi:hypothetical protein